MFLLLDLMEFLSGRKLFDNRMIISLTVLGRKL